MRVVSGLEDAASGCVKVAARTASLFVAASALAALTACGGGGDAGMPAAQAPVAGPEAPPAVPVAGRDFPLAAVTSVPAPDYGTNREAPLRAAAFNEINRLRAQAGLGLLRQDAALDRAAQGQALYTATAGNNFDHFQVQGQPNFVSVYPWDRARVAGYPTVLGDERTVNEIMAVVEGTPTQAQWSVEQLTWAIYHRFAALDPSYTDVGIGVAFRDTEPTAISSVILPGRSSTAPLGQDTTSGGSVANGVAIWPVDGATNVPTNNGAEIPSPPGGGLAASLHCHNRSTLTVTSFVLRNAVTGAAIPSVLLNKDNDPGQALRLTPCFAAAVPVNVLPSNTRVQVDFVGTLVRSGVVTPITRSWSFTTGVRGNGWPLCPNGTYVNGITQRC